jgi:hypothetical protein
MSTKSARKRHAPLDDNGEPVSVPVPKRRKNAPKQGVPVKKKATVEEIPEDPVRSNPPQNPRNILEASDGSDGDLGLPSSTPMEVDSDEDENVEEGEENAEAELGLCLLSTLKHQC